MKSIKKTPILTFNNCKGGVAKSTSSYTIAYALSKMKKANGETLRVLLTDNDPQFSTTLMAGIRPKTLDYSLAHVMLGSKKPDGEKVRAEDCILQIAESLYLLPSQLELCTFDSVGSTLWSREYTLKRALDSVSGLFDCIIIDNNPSLSLLPLNALAAATHVIVPCATDYLSYEGLELMLGTIKMVQENLNSDLQLYGVLCTMYDQRQNHAKEALTLFKRNFPVIGTIPMGSAVKDAIYSETGCVIDYKPKSKAAISYTEVAQKIYDDFGFGKDEEKVSESEVE